MIAQAYGPTESVTLAKRCNTTIEVGGNSHDTHPAVGIRRSCDPPRCIDAAFSDRSSGIAGEVLRIRDPVPTRKELGRQLERLAERGHRIVASLVDAVLDNLLHSPQVAAQPPSDRK